MISFIVSSLKRIQQLLKTYFLSILIKQDNAKKHIASSSSTNETLLSPETIAIIKATAPVVGEAASDITTTFYDMLFANHPELWSIFNKTNQRSGRQSLALAHAVTAFALHVENLNVIAPKLKLVAHKHCALSIQPEHYRIVHKNLMVAIAKVLGNDVLTDEIANAWSNAVLALAKIMADAEEDLYKTNEARQGGWRYEREFQVTSLDSVASNVKAVRFQPTDGYTGGFDFMSGQYLTLRIKDTSTAPRHYTLTSKPGDDSLGISVRKGGEMSTYIHETLAIGDRVLLGAPCGVFVPRPGKAVLISAGIGITPMVSFLHHFGAENIAFFLHLDRTAEQDAYSHLFANVTNKKILYTAGCPANAAELAKEVASSVKCAGEKDITYYVCGPNKFMAEVSDALVAAGVEKSSVKMEVFGVGDAK